MIFGGTVDKVFIDTAPIIYLLEDHPLFSESSRKIVGEYFESGSVLCTSVLTYTEFSVHPYRSGHPEKVDDLESFAKDSCLQVYDVSKEIALNAAKFRAKYASLKSMDSLQLACAVNKNCSVFLTNDKQLCQVDEIHCRLIE